MVVMLLQQHVCPRLTQGQPPPASPTDQANLGSYEKVPQQSQRPPPPAEPRPAPAQRAGPPLHALHYDNRAMQYYRLWIYTCNGLLLLCVLGFAIVACRTVVVDHRRTLVPGLSLLQPTFLYAYLAVITQSGLVQLVGCLGARRLNQKLLNVYWLVLLLLLFGDAMVGVVWIFRFENIRTQLRPWLKQRLAAEYGVDPVFTAVWDAFQRDNHCCGAENAHDFTMLNRSSVQPGWLPDSCCRPAPPRPAQQPPRTAALRNHHYHGTTTSTPSTTSVAMEDEYHIFPSLPDSDGRNQGVDMPELFCGDAGSQSAGQQSAGQSAGQQSTGQGGGRIITHPVPAPELRYHRAGCEERLLRWLRQTADILFILGYCVIGFLKLCFLGILRYEIKEMIQKIRMLQGELNAPQIASPSSDQPPGADTQVPGGRKSPTPQAARFSNNNGSLVTGRGAQAQDDSPVIGTSRTPQERRGRADSGTTPLLLQPGDSLQQQQHTPLLHHRHHHHHLSLHNDGNDSDTNSHCALLISDDVGHGGGGALAAGGGEGKVSRQGSNGNNNYELHELHDINRILARHRSDI